MIYLDNSATNRFKPQKVLNAVLNELVNSSNSGRGSHTDAIECAFKISACRDAIKELTNANDKEIIFTKNCSEALNIAILGTAKKNGHIITTNYEHNSVLRPLTELEKEGIEHTIVWANEKGEIEPEKIENSIKNNTYMIIVNHISNVTGTEQNIKEIAKIAKKHNLLFLVDGAQSIGHTKIDTTIGIDMLAGAGHKGMLGPQGTGCLIYDSKKINLKPIMFGGTGTVSDQLSQPTEAPEGFEVGTLNSLGIVGLLEGVNYVLKNLSFIENHILKLHKLAMENLRNNKKLKIYTLDNNFNGIIALNISDAQSGEIGKISNDKYKIETRTGLHCAPLVHKYLGTLNQGLVRASIGLNNTERDILEFCRAINDISINY